MNPKPEPPKGTHHSIAWATGALVFLVALYLACPFLFSMPFYAWKGHVLSLHQASTCMGAIEGPAWWTAERVPKYQQLLEFEEMHEPTGVLLEFVLKLGEPMVVTGPAPTPTAPTPSSPASTPPAPPPE